MANFKYFEILSQIKEMLKNYEDGQRLPTEPEMVQHFAVSRNTIRRALMELEKEGMVRRKQGTGTFFQGSPHKKSSCFFRIGVVNFYFSHTIYPELLHGIEDELHQHDYSMVMANSGGSFEKELEVLKRTVGQEIDGLIYEPSHNAAFSQIRFAGETEDFLRSLKIPVVTTHCRLDGFNFSSISVNNRVCGRDAASYLFNRGHRKVAVCYKVDSQAAVGRQQGFSEFYKEKGSPLEPHALWGYNDETEQKQTYKMAADSILKQGFTAVFAFNDEVAVQLIREFRNQGAVIPDDISVIGFDNLREGEFSHPSLTTFAHPGRYLGKWAVRLLINKIENPSDPPANMKLSGHFIERESVRSLL